MAIPKAWKWAWVAACLLASVASALGSVLIIRAGFFLPAVPTFLLSGGFGFWAWWEVRRIQQG